MARAIVIGYDWRAKYQCVGDRKKHVLLTVNWSPVLLYCVGVIARVSGKGWG